MGLACSVSWGYSGVGPLCFWHLLLEKRFGECYRLELKGHGTDRWRVVACDFEDVELCDSAVSTKRSGS